MLQRATVTMPIVFEDEQTTVTTITEALESAARTAGAHDAAAATGAWASAGCVTCGVHMTLTAVEVSHHLNDDGAIDYGLDADHVAVAPTAGDA